MAINLGTGPSLKDASPYLRDDAERHARILAVTEVDSVIEGLPPFQADTRARIAAQLNAIAAEPLPGPNGSPPSSAPSSS